MTEPSNLRMEYDPTFSIRPDTGENCTPAVAAALAACRARGSRKLIFPPGTYDFHEAGATERYAFISNNDSGCKRVVFALDGLEDFTLEGTGAQFVFHGRINPFLAGRCRGLTLRGFSVDFARSFITPGDVLAVGTDWMALQLPADASYRIHDGRIDFFEDPRVAPRPYINFMEYDTARREVRHDTTDCYFTNCAREIEPGKVRFEGVERPPRADATVVMKHELRAHPAIALDECRDVRIEQVTIHHSCGMGVIAQNCADLTLAGFRVTLPPGSDRLVSTSDDATHFVNCRGHILMENCVFEHHWDDATNVHGIYRRLRRRGVGQPFLFLEAGHYQQLGVEIAAPGETLEFVDRNTLLTYHEAKVKAIMPLTPQITRVEFYGALPDRFRDGDAAASLDRTPSLTVRNCVVRNNKPRGLLVTTPQNVLIENNRFHTAGAAIYISGDANFWFESGGVKNVVIRGNTFDNCNYMKNATGRAVIDIAPEIAPEYRSAGNYHGCVRIEQNVFRTFQPGDRGLIQAHSIAQLDASDNRIEPTRDYPAYGT